jgi:hypothetical protein
MESTAKDQLRKLSLDTKSKRLETAVVSNPPQTPPDDETAEPVEVVVSCIGQLSDDETMKMEATEAIEAEVHRELEVGVVRGEMAVTGAGFKSSRI